jgi:putative phage-type endonuclease
MGKKHYHIIADLDDVDGYLRTVQLEGRVELTDEELARLKKDPQFAKELGLSTRVDYEVEDVGEVDALTVFEVDEEGITQKEVDMAEDRSLGMECDCYNEDFAKTDHGKSPVGIADKMFRFEVKDAPEQGTDKWLEWRKQGITATEAASIMYPSKWGSPLSIYTDKLGLTQKSQDDSDGFMEWGHRIEDLLVNKFMEQHKGFTVCTQGRLYQRDWAKCSLDAQCFDENGVPVIIECKTGQHEEKWDPIPDRYYAQVQWQMYVTGIRKAYFSVLIQGHIWFEREVEYCPEYVKQLKEKCFYVWDCIQRKQAPATLGDFESDKTAIAALAGESGHNGEPVDVDTDTVGKYIALKEAYEKAEKEFNDFKNSLAFKMVDHSKLLCEGKTFASWVERKGAVSIDKNLLKEKYPAIYDECLKQGAPTRYIRYQV